MSVQCFTTFQQTRNLMFSFGNTVNHSFLTISCGLFKAETFWIAGVCLVPSVPKQSPHLSIDLAQCYLALVIE